VAVRGTSNGGREGDGDGYDGWEGGVTCHGKEGEVVTAVGERGVMKSFGGGGPRQRGRGGDGVPPALQMAHRR